MMRCPAPFAQLALSSEHQDAGLFSLAEVETLNIPTGYKRSIAAWLEFLARRG